MEFDTGHIFSYKTHTSQRTGTVVSVPGHPPWPRTQCISEGPGLGRIPGRWPRVQPLRTEGAEGRPPAQHRRHKAQGIPAGKGTAVCQERCPSSSGTGGPVGGLSGTRLGAFAPRLVSETEGPGPQELTLGSLAKSQENWQGCPALGNLASPKVSPGTAAGPRGFVSQPDAWGSPWSGASMWGL